MWPNLRLIGFESLISRGHVEDVDGDTTLSLDVRARHERGREYYSWIDTRERRSAWSAQECLAAASVTVLGVGGIGGAVASMLVAAGIGSIRLVDFDRVDTSNLNRQLLFRESTVGSTKVDAAAETLRTLNSAVTIDVVNSKITCVADIRQLIAGRDLLCLCADLPAAMPYWASEAAFAESVAMVNCSYAGPMLNFGLLVPGVTGCYRCMRQSEEERMKNEGRADLYSDAPPAVNAVIGSTAYMAGSWAAYEAIRYLADLMPQTVGRFFHQNLFDYSQSYYIDAPRRAGCEICK